jgi:hypothetical protein
VDARGSGHWSPTTRRPRRQRRAARTRRESRGRRRAARSARARRGRCAHNRFVIRAAGSRTPTRATRATRSTAASRSSPVLSCRAQRRSRPPAAPNGSDVSGRAVVAAGRATPRQAGRGSPRHRKRR